MEALMVIVLACQVHVSPAIQTQCQKELIECYEKGWPHTMPADKLKWYGPLKECLKNRIVK